MRYPILTAAALFLPLTAMSCPGEVSSQLGANTIHSTGGSAAIQVLDKLGGCHDWFAQGSITLMDVNITCTFTPSTGQFSKTLSVKSADPIQELIEANKNQQAQTQAALAAIMALVGALAPKPMP